MDRDYEKLVGKSKEEIIFELGFEFNYYPSDTWTYNIKKNWIGYKTILIIYFNEGIVKELIMVKTFKRSVKF